MKTILIATFLMMSPAAFAQQMPPGQQMPPTPEPMDSMNAPATPPAEPMGAPPPADAMPAPGGSPQITMGPPVDNPPPPPPAEYPRCSRTVMDQCTQPGGR